MSTPLVVATVHCPGPPQLVARARQIWVTFLTVASCGWSHGGSEKPGKLEVGGASRDSTGLGALEEGLISS